MTDNLTDRLRMSDTNGELSMADAGNGCEKLRLEAANRITTLETENAHQRRAMARMARALIDDDSRINELIDTYMKATDDR